MLRGEKVVLREKRLEDAANDYAWRRDPELARFDSVEPLRLSFTEFLAGYGEELESLSPQRRRFGIETLDGKHIGNCMYYNMDLVAGQVEVGIMVGDRAYWNQGYGGDAITALVDYIFAEMQVERIYLSTLEWNLRAQRCFEKCGFVHCGHLLKGGGNFIIMELRRGWLPRAASA